MLSKQAPNATHFVVFDACRNELNLSGPAAKALGSEKGFVPIQQTSGMLIAYATAPKQTASDAGQGGGPYAKALAAEIITPGVEAVAMFRRVQLRVKQTVGQEPWLSLPFLPEVYLAGRAPVSVPPPTVTPPGPPAQLSEAAVAWERIRQSQSVVVLEAFAKQFPGTVYAAEATERIADLKRAADEQQRVALLQKQDEDKKRAEAAAAHAKRQADEAATRAKAEADAKAQAEARRQADDVAKRAAEQARRDPSLSLWAKLSAQTEEASVDGRFVMLVPGDHSHFNLKFETKPRVLSRPYAAEFFGCGKDAKCAITICNEPSETIKTHAFYGSRCKNQPPLSVQVMLAPDAPDKWKTLDVYLLWPGGRRPAESVALTDAHVQVGVKPDLWLSIKDGDPDAKLLYARWTVERLPGRTPQLYLLISPMPLGEQKRYSAAGVTPASAPAASTPPPPPSRASVLVELSGLRNQDLDGDERRAATLKCLAQASDPAPQIDVHYKGDRTSVLRFSYLQKASPTIFGTASPVSPPTPAPRTSSSDRSASP